MTINVTTTPAKDLAYTNCAYCSPTDLRNFLVPGSKFADAFVLTLAAHDAIPNGQLQRRYAKVSTGDSISVSRFVPTQDFNLALLTLDLEFVKKGTKEEQVDAYSLADQVRKRFANQIMTTGQKVTLEYHGNGYIVTVNQATVKGQEKSNVERGMVSADTYVIFEAANSSGIKIVNQREAASSNNFRKIEFNYESLGIGGPRAVF
ncbi:vesicle-fusing ATPase-like [Solanum pennellii]|uniref:Vesicle-fusing ATPase n=1 Tax=Solanum pennellii TaxID=28526 RepID=A0ABM1FVU7_SOLPN|nr:vesicle-fusing ATPase-like [Solanum pennellii]